jgi:large subunit ribosomal protein L3
VAIEDGFLFGTCINPKVWAEKLPDDLGRLLTISKQNAVDSVEPAQSDKSTEIRAIVATQPRQSGSGHKKPELFEVKVAGGSMAEQIDYLKGLLGKDIHISKVFEEGGYVDVVGVTKGKGIQGPVKRWGVKTLPHKSRKTVRGVGTLGPWTPHYVMYTVPRAGQMGFHQRTEFNKHILTIGGEGLDVVPDGSFNIMVPSIGTTLCWWKRMDNKTNGETTLCRSSAFSKRERP